MAKKVKLLLTVSSVVEIDCAHYPENITAEEVMQTEQHYLDIGDIDVLDYAGSGEGVIAIFNLVGVES